MNNTDGTINPIEFEYRCKNLSKRIEALDEHLNAFQKKIDQTLLSLKGVNLNGKFVE